MELIAAEPSQRARWNEFVAENFPAVGAFFQTWEWGEFQREIGNRVERYIVKNDGEWRAVLLAVKHLLPLGLYYIYAPRGPVLSIASWNDSEESKIIIELLTATLKAKHPSSIFIRFEPAVENPPLIFLKRSFRMPPYYIQPRFNEVVDISRSEEEILSDFSAPMRNNVRKAARKGVSVELKSSLNENEWKLFKKMIKDTEWRAGKSIFPDEKYFRLITEILPSVTNRKDADLGPHSGIFIAYHNGEPSAINIVIFFSKTATFLFGAAFTHKLSVKISPYLHWASMMEAKKLGFKYYDLGGVDSKRWETLTYFKQQFGGSTVKYMGNVDIVFKPLFYMAYNILRKLFH